MPAPARKRFRSGKTKLGIVACTEIQLCRDFGGMAERESTRWGLRLVYKGSISLAQPDFTAECVSSRNAGVETMMVAADSNTIRRFAASCARQGYKPLFSIPAPAPLDEMKDDPNLNDNFISGFATFPYFQSNTEATREFQAAKAQFGPTVTPAPGLSIAWVAGKLLEQVAANVSEPPTSAALLNGLWRIKSEDLGGLTAPLTFNENQKPTPSFCWFNVALRRGQWVSADGFTRQCADVQG